MGAGPRPPAERCAGPNEWTMLWRRTVECPPRTLPFCEMCIKVASHGGIRVLAMHTSPRAYYLGEFSAMPQLPDPGELGALSPTAIESES